MFDSIAEDTEEFVDTVAERVVALGGIAEGTIRNVRQRTKLPVYPPNITSGRDHIEALSSALATVGKAVRTAIDRATELGDADTADLFTEVYEASIRNFGLSRLTCKATSNPLLT